MRLNHDLIRDLLLALEDNLTLGENGLPCRFTLNDLLNVEKIAKYPSPEIIYTTQRLIEAGYISAKMLCASNQLHELTYSHLTFDGHQYLDSIRDKEVWDSVKAGLSKVGGSAGLSLILNIANSVIRRIIGF